jgi:hypothetical protein
VSDIQTESQAVLKSTGGKFTSVALFKCGKNDGMSVYIPKDTTLKEMADKINEVKPAFLF